MFINVFIKKKKKQKQNTCQIVTHKNKHGSNRFQWCPLWRPR